MSAHPSHFRCHCGQELEYHLHAADPQDVSVVEQTNFLLDKCHTLSCAITIIEEISECG